MENLWIEPPNGILYGFPKMWDGKGNIMDFIIKNGYPQSEIDAFGDYFYVRQWHAKPAGSE